MPYMYILECSDGSYYTGSTWDLERRLWEHQNGLGAKHTAKRLPVTLLYCEECERIEDAYIREKQIQGWSRKKKQALMASDLNRIHILAACRNQSHSRNFGFDSAQPTGTSTSLPTDSSRSTGNSLPTGSAQPTDVTRLTNTTQKVDSTSFLDSNRHLSRPDFSTNAADRSLSGVEGNIATEPTSINSNDEY